MTKVLEIGSSGFTISEGMDADVIRVRRRAQLSLGEWFLDPGAGIPYYTSIIGSNLSPELIGGEIAVYCEQLEEISRVILARASLNNRTREVEITMVVESANGRAPISQVVDIGTPNS